MKKRILVAPLNWGLGHATRTIPIVHALIEEGFEPIIASDGDALLLLKKEFPNLTSLELPSYHVSYPKNGRYFKIKVLMDSPKLLSAIKAEKKITQTIIRKHNIWGIISDNRLGVYHEKLPSVIITHQVNVLSGCTTWLTSKLHQSFIKKFNECWIPDMKGALNLSGELGHITSFKIPIKYIGPLSRFAKIQTPIKNDLLVLISGPEPQRTLLEKKLLTELKTHSGKIVFVRGIVEAEQSIQTINQMTIYNFMTARLLEKTINESALILSRSGYTTIMDLSKLNKKAFFIPTPGQFEQEYLAKRLAEQGLAPYCLQSEFTSHKLREVHQYKGLQFEFPKTNYGELFNSLFQGK
ncbi:glycosyltransferase [Aestuariivivens sediminis]|uniref:glycosyltransferase n=1 Tax=Aestuariivivens sediminis TaxID=2913557 RepID=UPI001F59ECF1|nr:glycosyltransferase [Aestuariivivens sediminis]